MGVGEVSGGGSGRAEGEVQVDANGPRKKKRVWRENNRRDRRFRESIRHLDLDVHDRAHTTSDKGSKEYPEEGLVVLKAKSRPTRTDHVGKVRLARTGRGRDGTAGHADSAWSIQSVSEARIATAPTRSVPPSSVIVCYGVPHEGGRVGGCRCEARGRAGSRGRDGRGARRRERQRCRRDGGVCERRQLSAPPTTSAGVWEAGEDAPGECGGGQRRNSPCFWAARVGGSGEVGSLLDSG